MLILFLNGCKQEYINVEAIFGKPALSDSLNFYFPTSLNDTIKHKNRFYDNFRQNWYSSSLYSFKVPILYNKTDNNTTYRLLWLRSLDTPICISMKEYACNYYLNVRMLDRRPQFLPDINGKPDRLAFIVINTTVMLKYDQWSKIEKHLSNINFWTGPMRDPKGYPEADGARWIFEGRKNNGYHFIERCNIEGDLKNFGRYLVKISGLNIKDEDIY